MNLERSAIYNVKYENRVSAWFHEIGIAAISLLSAFNFDFFKPSNWKLRFK